MPTKAESIPAIDHVKPGSTNRYGVTLENQDLSLLRRWLTGDLRPEPPSVEKVDQARIKRWGKIAWEVFERKALLLAAARDLDENRVPEAFKLAATDIFVEKAQRYLTIRGRYLYLFGGAIALAALLTMVSGAVFLYRVDVLGLLHTKESVAKVDPAFLTVLVLKATSAGGLVVAAIYFLVSLSRALLHEATVLFNRRHSLRFGRLFVYLMSEKMTRDDLVAVFNWNAEFSTAFKDIQAENITKSPLTKIFELPVEFVKSTTELVKTVAEKTPDRTKETPSGN